MSTPSYGVVVGRFQTHFLTEGHIALLRTVKQNHGNRVIVFIGCPATPPTKHDPLSFEARRRMIQEQYPEFILLPITDRKTNEEWSKDLDNKIHEIAQFASVTLYGGRDSFIADYMGRHKTEEIQVEVSADISATKLREKVMNMMPNSEAFRAGVIHGMLNSFSRVIPTVDVAIAFCSQRGVSLLMAQKPGEKNWRFVGGHAEGTSLDYETDAIREAEEESNVKLRCVEYVGSSLIKDWRYQNTPEVIKTVMFLGWAKETLAAEANDDVSAVRWFHVDAISRQNIEPAHQPLFDMLKLHLIAKGILTN